MKSQLFDEIVQGTMKPGDRLPAEAELVSRFGVSRHTVRRALAELVELGLVRVEQGRGAFVYRSVLHYRLSSKVTHSENLLLHKRAPSSRFLAMEEREAQEEVAEGLGVRVGDPVYAINSVSFADGIPVATGWNFLSRARFPGLALPRRRASMSALYAKYGLQDYRRLKTTILARSPTESEARLLQQPASRWVLVTKKVDGDPRGRPICYGEACWAADRVQLVVEPEDF